ncbi:4'-phosphopantetheinyl transferase [Aurantivibrio infirmus]
MSLVNNIEYDELDIMITEIPNALDLGQFCQQSSCLFDKNSYQESVQEQFGIYVPEKMSRAVPKRKAEYIAGRYCARKSLGAINISDQAVGTSEERAPVWPEGVVGSITHSAGFASAVVAKAEEIRGIGIDSEKCIKEKTANNIRSHILTERETFGDNPHVANNDRLYLTVVFSAKESIYKCLNPIVKQFFDFKHAVIKFDVDRKNQFSFELLKTLNNEFCLGYQGRGEYFIDDEFIHTAVVLKK